MMNVQTATTAQNPFAAFLASFKRAWIITRREIRDTLRDWRIVFPILILTLVFPFLMQFTADEAMKFVNRYGATLIGERIIPFLLMVVSFFPLSFCLVIALETFVGEKERQSLEPLLATPLSNAELYWGKTMAAMIPPVVSSYLGLAVYLIGLYVRLRWVPPLPLLTQVILLSTGEALVMVSGAVVISSQTTTVRAANLLASFIIIPMALLVQVESLVMFWARYNVLWWILAALIAVDLTLVRMGIQIFNREELLGREIDQLDLGKTWKRLVTFFLLPPEEIPHWEQAQPRFSLIRFYRHDIPQILRRTLLPISLVILALGAAMLVGWGYAMHYRLPPNAFELRGLPADMFEDIPPVGFLPSFSAKAIFLNNIRSLAAGALLGLFSFGTAAVALLMVPMAIIGFFMGQVAFMGESPWLFFATFILPHGLIELPAAIIATAATLRLGASFLSPREGMSLSEGVLWAVADFFKLFIFLVIPLLLIAAYIEVHITPQLVLSVYGG